MFMLLFNVFLSVAYGATGLAHPNLALLPRDCGEVTEDRILTDRPGLDEFPWMTVISFRTREGFRFECAGTVLNDRYVLTAAKCAGRDAVGVRVGDYELASSLDCIYDDTCESHYQDILIKETIVHENFIEYPFDSPNDIALLRVKERINFNYTNVAPICLPVTSELEDASIHEDYGTIVSWELNRDGTLMRKSDTRVMSEEECRRENSSSVATDKDFCVRNGTLAADAGGPLMIKKTYNGYTRYIQYGIFSRDGANHTRIYTNVAKYVGWILDHIKP